MQWELMVYFDIISIYNFTLAAKQPISMVVLNEAKAYQHDNGKWTEAMKIAVRIHDILFRPVSQKWKKNSVILFVSFAK